MKRANIALLASCRLECSLSMFVFLWGRKNRQYQWSIQYGMGYLSCEESIFSEMRITEIGCVHYFIMRPTLPTVSLFFFFLLNAYIETWYYFSVVPVESIVFLFSYSDNMFASCNFQR